VLYKVFLVEDEIVAREGIRDNVDWKSAGFEFCGEASDGELALPLIEELQPDVLITDIKMPFMDGLQLCKIVRERMPWVKIVILSGHDEFDYAQSAIKLGVSEYLLKPINAAEIGNVLQKVAALLDQERAEREDLKQLQNQIKDNLALQRERLLLRLVVGGVSSTEAIEQCQQLGLNMIAKCYLVVLIKVGSCDTAHHLEYSQYKRAQNMVSILVGTHSGSFLIKKSIEELLLVMNGENPEQLKQDGLFLARLIKEEVEDKVVCKVTVGVGSPRRRLTEISHSFVEALAVVRDAEARATSAETGGGEDLVETPKLDQSLVEHYLKTGLVQEFDDFFDDYLQPLAEAALQSYLVKHYIFVDIVLTTAQFVSNLGGEVDQIIPEIQNVERFLVEVKTIDQVREAIRKIFSAALDFRNSQALHERTKLIHQAKSFIDEHFTDPDLLLNEVAIKVNLSPSHFSVVFSREIGESYKDYLTRLRIGRAKELLRTTNLKCSEIAYRSGYNDPHYFSHVFKKNTGLPPQRFRQQPQISK
jgi:two-component system response regulator YesN